MIHRNKKQIPIQIIGKNYIPLLCLEGGNTVLCFSRGSFFLLDAVSLKKSVVCKIKLDKKRRIASFFPILVRRFGINEVKCVQINEEFALVNYHRKFYIFNLKKWEIDEIPKGKSNGSVLSFAKTSNGIMFGDYGYNPQKKEMGIYLLKTNPFKIEQVYLFKAGEINHIHRIVEEDISGRLWILTGDFGNSASILYTDDFFATINKAVAGSQQYRSCTAVPHNQGLIYLTDTPMEENHIIKLIDNKIEKLLPMNGSCIYSALIGDSIIYSTTVENETNELNNKSNAYRYNLGKGIKDWYVELNSFNICNYKQKSILRIKKDVLPMLPFQYGCFRFAYENEGEYLYFYGQAIEKYDQVVIRIKKEFL